MLDNEKHRQEHLQEVVEAAEAVIALVDTTQLALHFGVRQDEDDVRAAKVRSELGAGLLAPCHERAGFGAGAPVN